MFQSDIDSITSSVIVEGCKWDTVATQLAETELLKSPSMVNSINNVIAKPRILKPGHRSFKDILESRCRTLIILSGILILCGIGIFVFFVIYKSKGEYKCYITCHFYPALDC